METVKKVAEQKGIKIKIVEIIESNITVLGGSCNEN